MDKPSNTADDILAAARRFIVAGGYNGFSYADIAEVVGIRKASIHHHFPSKVDLVQTLVRRYLEEAVTGMTELERNVP
ncbi:TetR/AcrR family transcriptional regulator, partial [Mesorhizobium sp. M8A.F.Ca.ET.142.01.1.1]